MRKYSKGVSDDMIIIIAFILIFAFLFAIMITKSGDMAAAGAGKVPKYQIYFKCVNSLSVGWDYAKACANGLIKGA